MWEKGNSFPLASCFHEKGIHYNNILSFFLAPLIPKREEWENRGLACVTQPLPPFSLWDLSLHREHILFCSYFLQTSEWQALPAQLEAFSCPTLATTVWVSLPDFGVQC